MGFGKLLLKFDRVATFEAGAADGDIMIDDTGRPQFTEGESDTASIAVIEDPKLISQIDQGRAEAGQVIAYVRLKDAGKFVKGAKLYYRLNENEEPDKWWEVDDTKLYDSAIEKKMGGFMQMFLKPISFAG